MTVPAASPLSITARALLFDMDGTLVDSIAVVERVWTELAARFGHDPAVVLREIHGVRAGDSIRRLAPEGSDLEALENELTTFEIDHAADTVEIPGAAALLAALAGGPVALVTSANLPLMRGRMRGAGVGEPATIVTAEDVERGKPAPDGYLLGARLLGVEPADTVVFEDAEAGIRAGLDAGMRVVVVGGHESATTRGLTRIRDYRGVTVTVDGTGITLEWPPATLNL